MISVSVISIVRLMALMAIDFNDITYTLPMGVLWTVLEPQLAIVCANMPVLKPILSRMFPRLFGSTNQKSYGVSDPQAFERLDERGYSLGKVSRNPLDTHVSGGGRLKERYTTTTAEHRRRVAEFRPATSEGPCAATVRHQCRSKF